MCPKEDTIRPVKPPHSPSNEHRSAPHEGRAEDRPRVYDEGFGGGSYGRSRQVDHDCGREGTPTFTPEYRPLTPLAQYLAPKTDFHFYLSGVGTKNDTIPCGRSIFRFRKTPKGQGLEVRKGDPTYDLPTVCMASRLLAGLCRAPSPPPAVLRRALPGAPLKPLS